MSNESSGASSQSPTSDSTFEDANNMFDGSPTRSSDSSPEQRLFEAGMELEDVLFEATKRLERRAQSLELTLDEAESSVVSQAMATSDDTREQSWSTEANEEG
ncbi:hypothetical protein P7C73_g1197, partial [Tremellales sp. Uapishka_1]